MDAFDVVVIGAGAAGLAAASQLCKQDPGLRIAVLEASSRLGGRIYTYSFPDGQEVEVGAQWMHGEKGNVAMDIAKKRNLAEDPRDSRMMPNEMEEEIMDEAGDVWNPKTVEAMSAVVEGIQHKETRKKNDKFKSLGEFYETKIKKKGDRKDEQFRRQLSIYNDYWHREVQTQEGCDNWHQVSFHASIRQYKVCPGSELVPFKSDQSYTRLLDYFTESIPKGAIKLNSEVVKIFWKGENGITIQTSNGEQMYTKFVVVTVSLGVLKESARKLFEPELPHEKIRHINLGAMGAVMKIHIEYSEPWWPTENFEGFGFVYGDVINYDEADAEKDWTRFILGMYKVLHRKNVLCMWLSGPAARKVEGLEDDRIMADLANFLRKRLSKRYPRMTDPIDLKVSRWFTNPLFRGCYSYTTVKAQSEGFSRVELAKPLGRIHFAGEATHPEFFSTVHGAIESGWREADRITKTIRTAA